MTGPNACSCLSTAYLDRSVTGVQVEELARGQALVLFMSSITMRNKSRREAPKEVVSTQELQEQDVWENDIHSPSLSTGGEGLYTPFRSLSTDRH